MEEKEPKTVSKYIIGFLIIVILGIVLCVTKYFFYDEPMSLLINAELTDAFTSVYKIEKINELKYRFAQILGGFGGLLLLAVQIYRTMILNKQQVEFERTNREQEYQAKADSEEQRRSNSSREILDQYMKAVDQLKDNNIAVRLGGIYSLEKIMNSTAIEAKVYHNSIIELLCAYYRQERSYSKDEEIKDTVDYFNNRDQGAELPEKYWKGQPTEFQAILTILGRRADFEDEIRIDLHSSSLIYADLCNGNFRNADLSYANIYRADLINTNLDNADFTNSSIKESNVFGASFRNAVLIGTDATDIYTSNIRIVNGRMNLSLEFLIEKLKEAKYIAGMTFSNSVHQQLQKKYTEFENRIDTPVIRE